MSVLLPVPHPISDGCNPTITDVDNETEEPESYKKRVKMRMEESDHDEN